MYYKAKIMFKKDCEMENNRAYTVIHNIMELVNEVHYKPTDIIENDESINEIRENGFLIAIKSLEDEVVIKTHLENTIFLEYLEFEKKDEDWYIAFEEDVQQQDEQEEIKIPEISIKYVESQKDKLEKKEAKHDVVANATQNIISVNVDKLDKLMDMVGELVIAEAMVTQNPEVVSLEIESFDKASRQLHKISSDLQDLVMATDATGNITFASGRHGAFLTGRNLFQLTRPMNEQEEDWDMEFLEQSMSAVEVQIVLDDEHLQLELIFSRFSSSSAASTAVHAAQ